MSPQKRRKDPTNTGGTVRAQAVDPESVVQLEAELPPTQRPRRPQRKLPPPLPRPRKRTLEVDLAQIEAEIAAEQRIVAPGELLYAPCHAATAYHKLSYRQATLLAAVDGQRTVAEIAARSGIELESAQSGLETLCNAGLIRRVS